MPTGIMLKSLCENNTRVNVHVIIDESVTNESKKSLEEIVKSYEHNNICFYLIDGSFFNNFPSLNVILPRITKATYYRLFLAKILPNSVDKVLFLDGDIIINKNLSSLWERDVNNIAVCGVIDQENDNIDVYNRLQYSPEFGYFNAGVLLINLLYWRTHDMTNKFLQFVNDYPERIKYHDQDVLNGVLHDNKLFLPIKYNTQTAFFYKKEYIKYNYMKFGVEIMEARENPFIVHFSTDFKPWNDDCAHPYRELFLYYKNLTQWRNVPLVENFYPNRSLRVILGDFFRLIGLRKQIKKQESYKFFYNN